jgi:hypothetical protein
MNETDSGRVSHGNGAGGESDWPQTPDRLVYQLDVVIDLFDRIQAGQKIDLLEGLLDCVDWREMFGSDTSGPLKPDQLAELKGYYRAKFSGLDRFYLAEQLSTELMTALMVSGDLGFSDELKRLGQQNPALWQEIRTFFSRKEVTTALALQADRPLTDGDR